MVDRVTYRTRKSYNTKSNAIRKVRTPGGRLVVHRVEKVANHPKCGMCKKALTGLPALRPFKYSQLSKSKRTVNRAYGGSQCHKCVQNKILKAFLMDEKKCVDKIVTERNAQAKQKQRAAASSGSKKKVAAGTKKAGKA